MTRITFNYAIQYQPDPHGNGNPYVLATAKANSNERSFSLVVDSGAQFTLIREDFLAGLGFSRPPAHEYDYARAQDGSRRAKLLDDLECRAFGGAAGSEAIGRRFWLDMSIDGGPQNVRMQVYGIMGRLDRNLLGRDFIRVFTVGFLQRDTHDQSFVYMREAV